MVSSSSYSVTETEKKLTNNSQTQEAKAQRIEYLEYW